MALQNTEKMFFCLDNTQVDENAGKNTRIPVKGKLFCKTNLKMLEKHWNDHIALERNYVV